MSDTVLVAIVDDDAGVRESTECVLQILGYSTATFESAKEFLKFGRLSDVWCLISDFQMPDMNGYELQLRLIASGPKFPIIFITAHVDEALRTRMLAAGAHAMLTKPYQVQSLADHLATALKKYHGSISDQASLSGSSEMLAHGRSPCAHNYVEPELNLDATRLATTIRN